MLEWRQFDPVVDNKNLVLKPEKVRTKMAFGTWYFVLATIMVVIVLLDVIVDVWKYGDRVRSFADRRRWWFRFFKSISYLLASAIALWCHIVTWPMKCVFIQKQEKKGGGK